MRLAVDDLPLDLHAFALLHHRAALDLPGRDHAALVGEPGLEEQVAYTKALDHAGIPYFVSEFEESMTSFDHLEIQLQTFVENLLFR